MKFSHLIFSTILAFIGYNPQAMAASDENQPPLQNNEKPAVTEQLNQQQTIRYTSFPHLWDRMQNMNHDLERNSLGDPDAERDAWKFARAIQTATYNWQNSQRNIHMLASAISALMQNQHYHVAEILIGSAMGLMQRTAEFITVSMLLMKMGQITSRENLANLGALMLTQCATFCRSLVYLQQEIDIAKLELDVYTTTCYENTSPYYPAPKYSQLYKQVKPYKHDPRVQQMISDFLKGKLGRLSTTVYYTFKRLLPDQQ